MAVQTFEKQAITPEFPVPSDSTGEAVNNGHSSTARAARPRQSEDLNDFNYHPVPVLAVVGLVLAVISSTALFVWLLLPLCLLALLLSGLGMWMIRRSDGSYGGTGVALSGMFLSLVFFMGGIAFQVYAYQTEVPAGYERISFVRDISDKRINTVDGKLTPPPDVAAFDGKKIFLKGYIYQTKQTQGLHSFLFVKDNASCCFGANPEVWDRLGVVMDGDKTINYHAGKVAVAGTFRVNPKFDPNGELEPLYIVTADQFTTRVSDF